MKIKFMTKLISAVCAAAMATACVAMPVGAVRTVAKIKEEMGKVEKDLEFAQNDLDAANVSGWSELIEECVIKVSTLNYKLDVLKAELAEAKLKGNNEGLGEQGPVITPHNNNGAINDENAILNLTELLRNNNNNNNNNINNNNNNNNIIMNNNNNNNNNNKNFEKEIKDAIEKLKYREISIDCYSKDPLSIKQKLDAYKKLKVDAEKVRDYINNSQNSGVDIKYYGNKIDLLIKRIEYDMAGYENDLERLENFNNNNNNNNNIINNNINNNNNNNNIINNNINNNNNIINNNNNINNNVIKNDADLKNNYVDELSKNVTGKVNTFLKLVGQHIDSRSGDEFVKSNKLKLWMVGNENYLRDTKTTIIDLLENPNFENDRCRVEQLKDNFVKLEIIYDKVMKDLELEEDLNVDYVDDLQRIVYHIEKLLS